MLPKKKKRKTVIIKKKSATSQINKQCLRQTNAKSWVKWTLFEAKKHYKCKSSSNDIVMAASLKICKDLKIYLKKNYRFLTRSKKTLLHIHNKTKTCDL